MRRGKEIAQGSHASADFLVEQIRRKLEKDPNGDVPIKLSAKERTWILEGMAKVCLRVDSEAELLEYHKKAQGSGLNSHLIRDSGRTEFQGRPTFTACAIGPDIIAKIDGITGELVPY